MGEIGILHLSDLHLVLSAEGENLRSALRTFAREHFAPLPEGRKLLVLTGDFHNFGGDYEIARKFLPALFEDMRLDKTKDVFMVPGNHDVDGASKDDYGRSATVDKLLREPEGIGTVPSPMPELLGWFGDYLDLVRDLGVYTAEACADRVPVGVHVRTWRDTLHLLHLNTALIADGVKEHKTRQLADTRTAASEEIRAQLGDGRPCLALGHNHIYDLDKSQWSESLRGAFAFGNVSAYLCGDRHTADREPRERTLSLGTDDGAAEIPIVCAPRGSADEGDKTSQFGFVLHVWDTDANEATWDARTWRADNPTVFKPGEAHSYPMRGDAPTRPEKPRTRAEELAALGLGDAARYLDAEAVGEARAACSDSDALRFCRVIDDYDVMLRALAGGVAVPREAEVEQLADWLRRAPVLLTGNGGMGKTTLMLMTALRHAAAGGVAVWLRPAGAEYPAGWAEALTALVTGWAAAGSRVLLCVDSPARDWAALRALRAAWLRQPLRLGDDAGAGGCVQVMLTERYTRLTAGEKELTNAADTWLDGLRVVELRRASGSGETFQLKGYETAALAEGAPFRKRLLLNIAKTCRGKTSASALARLPAKLDEELREHDHRDVNLVELVYRVLLPLLGAISRDRGNVLDWEEWGDVLRRAFDMEEDDKTLYGGLAVFRLLGVEMPVALFCRRFDLDPKELTALLRNWRLSPRGGGIEPVLYTDTHVARQRRGDWGTLAAKHDVIAELFFLLLGEAGIYESSFADNLFADYLDVMNEAELETLFLPLLDPERMRARKREREREKRKHMRAAQLHHRPLVELVCDRWERHELALTEDAREILCYALLLSEDGKRLDEWDDEVQRTLTATAPDTDGSVRFSSFYTEWGKWLARFGRKDAEEKFRAVIRADADNVPSRTELGRLLVKRGDADGAAEVYREILDIDRDNVHARTELGRLLAKRGDTDGAAEVYREILRIKPDDVPSRTELGRLLVRRGDEASLREAEALFREAMRIEPTHVHSRTELGRLLVRRGDEASQREAEALYREAIALDDRQLAPRHEWGLLLERLGREQNDPEKLRRAKRLYEEMLERDKQQDGARKGLARLRDV